MAVARNKAIQNLKTSGKPMSRFTLASCILLLFLSNAFAEETAKPDRRPRAPGDPIASVNGATITMKMLNEAFEGRIPATGHRNLSDRRLGEIQLEELNKLIAQELVFQEAVRLGLKADPKDIDSEYSKIRSRFISEEKFNEGLKQQGLTPALVREGLVRHLLIKKVVAQEIDSKIVITDEQMKEYYDGHREQFVIPDAVRLRRILVKVDPSGSPQDWEEAKKKIQGFILQAKTTDFSELARQYSEDEVTAPGGGDTGLLHQGMMDITELEQAAFSLSLGEVSQPIRTLYGYFIIKVEEKVPSKQLSFGDVKKDRLNQEMKESAHNKKMTEWIDGLRAKAEIKIY
jgi:parvulin-like peptidyl-prolyl isomerase